MNKKQARLKSKKEHDKNKAVVYEFIGRKKHTAHKEYIVETPVYPAFKKISIGGGKMMAQCFIHGDTEDHMDTLTVNIKTHDGHIELNIEQGGTDLVLHFGSEPSLSQNTEAVRGGIDSCVEKECQVIQLKDIIIHPGTREVHIKGESIELNKTQFTLLYYLASRPGWAFTRDNILDHLYGADYHVIDRCVDVHIVNLRRKLGTHRHLIETVTGVGYRFKGVG